MSSINIGDGNKDKSKNKNSEVGNLLLVSKALAEILSTANAPFFSFRSKKESKSIEQKKTELIKDLISSGIDPVLFDSLLTNEINRRLKIRFGTLFIVLTCFFTLLSYAIIVFDALFKWGISEIAITALIIETPIQFVGILYIIARNLFPSESS